MRWSIWREYWDRRPASIGDSISFDTGTEFDEDMGIALPELWMVKYLCYASRHLLEVHRVQFGSSYSWSGFGDNKYDADFDCKEVWRYRVMREYCRVGYLTLQTAFAIARPDALSLKPLEKTVP